MSGKHLKQLIRAHRDGDELAFRRTVQEIIEEEERKHHLNLARELGQLLASGASGPVGNWRPSPSPPQDGESGIELLTSEHSIRLLSQLVLPPGLAEELGELVREVESWPLLDSHGIPRRQTILLHGPPGCGKSSVAAAIAGELGYELCTVRIDAVVSSFLGETASNLRRVFDFATDNAVVLTLDEFDALGRERNAPNDHGEFRRIVNAILQMLERYSGPSIIVATSNHSGDLDPAVWRRFDAVFELPSPGRNELEAVLRRVLGKTITSSLQIVSAAASLEGLPHAAAESVALEARRSALLSGRKRISDADLQKSVEGALRRRWV